MSLRVKSQKVSQVTLETPSCNSIIKIKLFLESWSQEVKEPRCQRVSKVILEMSQVYPIIKDSIGVDRKRVYDIFDRQTNTMTYVLLEEANLYSLLNNIYKLT